MHCWPKFCSDLLLCKYLVGLLGFLRVLQIIKIVNRFIMKKIIEIFLIREGVKHPEGRNVR